MKYYYNKYTATYFKVADNTELRVSPLHRGLEFNETVMSHDDYLSFAIEIKRELFDEKLKEVTKMLNQFITL